MEKRERKRFPARTGVSGRVVLVADVNIHDLSLSGMRFECCERLLPDSRIQLLINRRELTVKVGGDVVRSSLRLRGNPGRQGKPFYEVAVRFSGTADSDRELLSRLIDLLEKDDRSK